MHKAMFTVGGSLVEATTPDGVPLCDSPHLVIQKGDRIWLAGAKELEEAYTPVSKKARHYYEAMMEKKA